MLLVPGHRRGAVVQDDGHRVALVVGHVQQGRQAGVEEGGIADDGSVLLGDAGLAHPVGLANAGPHAATGVQSRKGRQKAQRVAADVAVDHQLELVGGHKHTAMRAARAEQGRARRQGRRLWRFGFRRRDRRGLGQQPGLYRALAHDGGIEFATEGENALALDGDAHQADALFDERIQLFDDDQPLHPVGKLADRALGQGIGHPQLEERGLGEHLPGVLVGHAVGDDAQAGVAHLDLVVRKAVGVFGDLGEAFLDDRVPPPGVARHHDVFGAVDAVVRQLVVVCRLLGRPLS